MIELLVVGRGIRLGNVCPPFHASANALRDTEGARARSLSRGDDVAIIILDRRTIRVGTHILQNALAKGLPVGGLRIEHAQRHALDGRHREGRPRILVEHRVNSLRDGLLLGLPLRNVLVIGRCRIGERGVTVANNENKGKGLAHVNLHCHSFWNGLVWFSKQCYFWLSPG